MDKMDKIIKAFVIIDHEFIFSDMLETWIQFNNPQRTSQTVAISRNWDKNIAELENKGRQKEFSRM